MSPKDPRDASRPLLRAHGSLQLALLSADAETTRLGRDHDRRHAGHRHATGAEPLPEAEHVEHADERTVAVAAAGLDQAVPEVPPGLDLRIARGGHDHRLGRQGVEADTALHVDQQRFEIQILVGGVPGQPAGTILTFPSIGIWSLYDW